MEVEKMRIDLSLRCKNGISFLMAGVVIWSIITFLFFQPLTLQQKNIFMLWSTGVMFPLGLLFSKLIKAEWITSDNPLGNLALYLNLAQLIYFPFLIWALVKSPHEMLMFFAIITGAHFFPYGWLYRSKGYYIMAPIISVSMLLIGWNIVSGDLWIISAFMIGMLIVLIIFLYWDYKKKYNRVLSNQMTDI